MTRKSLRTKRIFSIILSLAVALTMMPVSALAADGTSTVENAVAEVTINGGTTSYADINAAFAAAQKADSATVKLLTDIKTDYHKEGNKFIFTDISGTYTLDLNGHTVNGSLEVKDANSNLTIKDSKETGKINPNDGVNTWPALTVSQGSVTIESGIFAKEVHCTGGAMTIKDGTFAERVVCNDSTLTINGGTFKVSAFAGSGSTAAITAGQFVSFSARNDNATVSISGGSFDQILCTGSFYLHPAAMLANGYAFADRTNSKKVDGSSEATISNIKVVKADEIHAFVASVTVGASIDKYQTFEEALTAAQGTKDSVLTLLDDITTAQISITDGDFVLDLNGKNLSGADSAHLIGVWMTNSNTPAKLTIRDSAGNGIIENTGSNTSVYCQGGDVTIEGGTLKGCLYWQNSGKITIKGGTFSSLQIGSEEVLGHLDTWVDAIAQGKALAKDSKVVRADVKQLNGGPYTVIDHTHSFAKNEADEYKCACGVPCPHTDINSATGKCNLCGKQAHAAAVIKDGNAATYATAQEAISNANGGTVKLLADAGEINVSSLLKLDCNGHTITRLTVSEGVTLASLLPEYYAFKSDDKWVSDSDLSNKTELANTTNAEAPVKYVRAKNPAITVKYGKSYTLFTTFAWTGSSSYSSNPLIEWEYKSGGWLHSQTPTLTGHENNSRTMDFPISKDNKRYPAQVGTYTYVVTFTKDGYSKSCEFTVTIEKATPSCTVKMADYTYGETPSNPALTGTTGNGTVAYYYNTTNSNEGGAEWTNTTALDAGTYYMYAAIGAATNYNAYTTPTQKFEVKKTTPITGEKRIVTGTYGQKLRDIDLNNQTGNIPGRWEWDKPDTKLDKASDGTVDYPVTFTPTDTTNYEIVKTEVSVKVNPAPGRELYERQLTQRLGDGATKTFKPDWTGLPKDEAGWSYNAEFKNIGDVTVTDSSYNIENDVLTYNISGGKAGDTVKFTLTASSASGNYEAFTITVVITLTEKDRPEVTVKPITVTYDGNPVSSDKITGAATFNGNSVEGKWSWEEGQSIISVADSGKKTVKFTPTDATNYESVDTTVILTINQATPVGKPAYDKVTASGKKLSEVNLSSDDAAGKNLFNVSGAVEWENGDTEVKQGEKYKWKFTPTDTDNYIILTGEIILWEKPASSGGGGGALPTTEVVTIDKVTTSPAEVKNETKTDADGTKETISKVTVSDVNQKEIIKQVKDNKSGEIVINVSEKEVADNAKLEISLDKDFIDSIVKDTDAKLTIKTPEGDKTFTQEELKKLSESAAADGTITVDPTASEPTDTTKAEKITKAKGLIEKLNLMARSSKTAKKNAKVILKRNETTNSCIKELKDLGFTVKYRFYRSTKKSAGYKSTVTKKTASYMNTNGKKGTKYFYKIQIRVYDENGKLIAKTALKQCKYASRIWSK